MSSEKMCCWLLPKMKIILIILAGVGIATLMSVYALAQSQSTSPSTIRMAAILFRHGEKNPTTFYPNDPHAQREWIGGLGALTLKGSLQAYNLGKNLRRRYHTLLPKSQIYSQHNLYAVSSYAERCIMSALALLAGLLPPTEKNSILPIAWQPVPITTIPRLEDTLIAQKKPCAKYETMLKEMYTHPPLDLAQINANNADLYNVLTKYTGKNISTVLDVEFLYNTLRAEEERGLELPQWTKGIYPNKLLPLAQRSYTVFTDNDFMKRIKGGGFLVDVHNNMIEKANKTLKPNRQLFLYSGHDVTLVNVMNSMKFLDQTSKLPDYASALAFELHEDSVFPKKYEIRIMYYSNSDVKEPIHIQIPNCPDPCTLDSFTKSISHLLFQSYDEICENPRQC